MSTETLRMRGPVHGTKDAKRVAIGSSVGAVIETYDFIGFGTAAALYFGTAFFPGADPVTGTLAAFATLGVGFAARPLGGGARRTSRRQAGPQARAGGVADRDGSRDLRDSACCHLFAGGAHRAGAAGPRPRRPGPRVRRRVGAVRS